NFGSLLGLFLLIQIIRGLFFSIHYCPNIFIAFNRIIHIIQNVPNGYEYYHTIFLIIILQNPYILSDPDNFIPANPIITPTHIQSELFLMSQKFLFYLFRL
ncbi:CYB protein, partial [Acromyrmex heyeri]